VAGGGSAIIVGSQGLVATVTGHGGSFIIQDAGLFERFDERVV
jgi:hypothetical protein